MAGLARGTGRIKQDPDAVTIPDLFKLAKDYPSLFETMMLGGLVQSPAKVVGRVGEATWAKGNANYQNELSSKVLDSITAPPIGLPGRYGFRPEMSESDKTKSYMKQVDALNTIASERAAAKELLSPDFTSDTTYGDVIDTASWISPVPYIKGAAKAVKTTSKVARDSARIAELVRLKYANRGRPAPAMRRA